MHGNNVPRVANETIVACRYSVIARGPRLSSSCVSSVSSVELHAQGCADVLTSSSVEIDESGLQIIVTDSLICLCPMIYIRLQSGRVCVCVWVWVWVCVWFVEIALFLIDHCHY